VTSFRKVLATPFGRFGNRYAALKRNGMGNIHEDDVRSVEEALAIGSAYVDRTKKWKRYSGN
jgi:hypothetical protein